MMDNGRVVSLATGGVQQQRDAVVVSSAVPAPRGTREQLSRALPTSTSCAAPKSRWCRMNRAVPPLNGPKAGRRSSDVIPTRCAALGPGRHTSDNGRNVNPPQQRPLIVPSARSYELDEDRQCARAATRCVERA